MRHVWTLVAVACMLGAASAAQAQGGIGGVGGSGIKPPAPPAPGAAIGGMHGIIGMSGCCGGMLGVPCHQFSGFSGLGGCCGGMMSGTSCFNYGMCGFNGCFGGAPASQTYSEWKPSPGATYHYRTLTVRTLTPTDAAVEFVLVHHPERPKFFYFYDPVDKKFFGRYLIGARPEQCFSVLSWNGRKATLKEVADAAYASAGPMPTFTQVIRPRPGTSVNPSLQNAKLLQPPESIPDALLGLPPEEPLLRKK